MMWLALIGVSLAGIVCGTLFVALECYKDLFSDSLDCWLNCALLARRVNFFNGLSYD